ncbi:MAG: 2-isopropylmalate synthase [bacterium]|nr:2-isopropylmalate synthase [bacterium]
MKKYPDYKYPDSIPIKNRQWPGKVILNSPEWCSVDLRDGNQALPIPMNPMQKLRYFQMLTDIGFKQIEVAFPSASKDDFDFVRDLIVGNHIPDDVTISVLTQARKHLIERTVESLQGVKKAILHCYVATSDLHSKIVFNKSRDEVINMAVKGTKTTVEALEKTGLRDKVSYEFSPEEFTDSDIDFVVELCEKVKEEWKPKFKGDLIVNLPATVERRPPNHYADMIEYFCSNYKYREETIVSLHAHNDQGCAVAASELALLAGADRVEGTLLGHGERTGNLDLITFSLNLHSRGIDTGLNLHKLPEIVKEVEDISGISVHPRHPYAGELVFTAFSGSHQDAIRKGMSSLEEASEMFNVNWKVPYLHVNPMDIGKKYEKLIRINSQSGKGGVAYILEKEFGLHIPKSMHPELGELMQEATDTTGSELSSSKLYELFKNNFISIKGPYEFISLTRKGQIDANQPDSDIFVDLKLKINTKIHVIEGKGNGPISAAADALRTSNLIIDFTLNYYQEQALGQGADATALAYITVKRGNDGKLINGAGEHSNIDWAAVKALITALNKAAEGQ